MLRQPGITSTTGAAPKQILFNVQNQLSLGVVISDVGAVTLADGTKVIKAGTPLTGNLDARTTAFTAAGVADATGVVLHDVNVTAGAANGTLLIFGFVNLNRLETDTKALIVAGVKTALNAKVTFITA